MSPINGSQPKTGTHLKNSDDVFFSRETLKQRTDLGTVFVAENDKKSEDIENAGQKKLPEGAFDREAEIKERGRETVCPAAFGET